MIEAKGDADIFDRKLVNMSASPFGFFGPRREARSRCSRTWPARYTHRVPISNSRLVALPDGQVTFRSKDYAAQGRSKTLTLTADEFLRRFLLVAAVPGVGAPAEPTGARSCPACGGQVWHLVVRVPRPTVAEVCRLPLAVDSS